jgi:hypothetical protein
MRQSEHIEHWAILLTGVALALLTIWIPIHMAGEEKQTEQERWDALWTTIGEEETP